MLIPVKLLGVKECGFRSCNAKINFLRKITGFLTFDPTEFR